MANQYYDVRVDINRKEAFDSGLRFTQGDSKVIYLRIAVMNGVNKFDASDATPTVNFVRPDGAYVTGTPVASDDVWVYQLLGNELQAAGKVLCDIKFTYPSGRISSGKFTIFVEKDTTISGAQASSSYVLPMEAALAEMNNYKQQGMTLAEAAEEYSEDSEAWAVGQRDGVDVPETDETYQNNSKYYAAQAKIAEENAEAIVGIGIATTSKAGLVKPDGSTITVEADGTIHSTGGSSSASWGSISGTLSDQTDLQNALNLKANAADVPAAQVNSDWNAVSGVAQILNKPTIPAAQVNSDWNAASGVAQILNKPTIPTVNNETLTIQQNGTTKATFTANSSTPATANIVTDEWTGTQSVSSGSVTFSGIDDSAGTNGYETFCNVTANSTNKNPSFQVSTISGAGTSNMSITYTTDADEGASVKLRIIK